jgi:hypothetical protein
VAGKLDPCMVLLALLAITLTTVTPSVAQEPPPPIDAKIEIVWPHDEQGNPAPVDTAPLVNAEVYLFERDTLNPVSCQFPQRVTLRWALKWTAGRPPYGGLTPSHHRFERDGLGHPIPDGVVGERVVREVDGKIFPVWVFNDVAVPRFADLRVGAYYFVEVEGVDARSNIWAHTDDPRAYLPAPRGPADVGEPTADSVDALIQIVWPHDGRGIDPAATPRALVNLGVDLAHHPATAIAMRDFGSSVGFGFDRPVRLLRSLNDGFLEPVKTADAAIMMTKQPTAFGADAWPRWVFNDIDVSAARDPANTYYFAVQVDGVPTHTTIWSHGADARTHFPQCDVPARGCGG